MREGLTVRKTEDLIDKFFNEKKPKERKVFLPQKAYIRDIRLLTNSIKEDLELMTQAGMDTKMDIEETDTGYNIQIYLKYIPATTAS